MAKPQLAKRSPIDDILDRVRDVCFAFAGADEKLSHGSPWFHVRGKMFLAFTDNHHGDGRTAVWIKATKEEQQRLVAGDPARYFVPPYVGVKGWVGVRLDQKPDYIDLAILVEAAWLSVAPPKYVRDPGAAPVVKRGPRVPLVKTDPAVAAATLARVRAICETLPAAACEASPREATFRVKKKPFAYVLDNYHRDGAVSVCTRIDLKEQARLVKADPKRYYSPQYFGPKGWLGIRVGQGKVDWKDIEARLRASYETMATTKKTSPAKTRTA
jgi:hypothetical protein